MSTPGAAIVDGNMVFITGYPVIMDVIMDVVKAAEMEVPRGEVILVLIAACMMEQRKGNAGTCGINFKLIFNQQTVVGTYLNQILE